MADRPCFLLHRVAPWCLVAFVAALPRLSQLNYVIFRGDESEDARMIRGMIEGSGVLPAGMANSIGALNFPLFDYLMAPPFALSDDPRIATAFVGLANVAAVLLTFAVTRRIWGTPAGLVASLLFAVAPWPVLFSRKIWPPYMIVLFSALCLYAMLRARERRSSAPWWLACALASWLWMCQLHPVGLFEAPVFALAGPTLWRRLRPLPGLVGLIVGCVPAIPFALYDGSHGWQNLRTYLAASTASPVVDGASVHWAVLNVTGLDTLQYAGIVYAMFLPSVDLAAGIEWATTLVFWLAMLVAAARCVWGFRRGASGHERESSSNLLLFLGWAWMPVLLTLRHGSAVYQHYYLGQLPAAFALLGYAAAFAGGWSTYSILRRGVQEGTSKTEDDPGGTKGSSSSEQSNLLFHRGRQYVVSIAVGLTLASWVAFQAAFGRYLQSGAASIDFGLSLSTTEAIGRIAVRAAGGGTLFAQTDDLTRPMVDFMARAVPRRENQPLDGLVVPARGDAGYLFGDDSLLPAKALKDAGATTIGEVSYLGGSRTAAAFQWRAGRGAPSLPRGLQPLPLTLANGVRFLGYAASRPSADVLRVEYVWQVVRVGAGVTDADLALYVHVIDLFGRTVAQKDGIPTSSSTWRAGDTMVAWLDVPLKGLTSAKDAVRGGMYRRPTIQRIPAVDPSGAERDGEFSLGTVDL